VSKIAPDGLLQLEIFLPLEIKQNMKSKKMAATELTINSGDGITQDNAPQKWALEFPGNDLLSSLTLPF
jgi:hypothetical protein